MFENRSNPFPPENPHNDQPSGNEIIKVHPSEVQESQRHIPVSIVSEAETVSLTVRMEQAKKYPRSIKAVKENALAELGMVPSLAETAYYSIPYKEGSGKKMVEGLTIKSAMALARWWGNGASDATIIGEDKSCYLVRGSYVDFETNNWNSSVVRVSKYYKPRGSKQIEEWDTDMLRNQILAGMSKARRNAILNTLPEWLKDMYFNRAKELVINPPKDGIKMVESLKVRVLSGQKAIMRDFNVTQKEMDKFMEEKMDGIDDSSTLANLKGLYTAIKTGQAHVDEVFRGGRKSVAMPQEKSKPETVEKETSDSGE